MRLTAGGVRELGNGTRRPSGRSCSTARLRSTAFDLTAAATASTDVMRRPVVLPVRRAALDSRASRRTAASSRQFDDACFPRAIRAQITDWVAHAAGGAGQELGRAGGELKEQLPPCRRTERSPGPRSGSAGGGPAGGRRRGCDAGFRLQDAAMAPTKKTGSGEVRIVDSRNFPAAANIAAAHVIVKPGGMRELYRTPTPTNGSTTSGKGRMTLSLRQRRQARTADFNANDVGYMPRDAGPLRFREHRRHGPRFPGIISRPTATRTCRCRTG